MYTVKLVFKRLFSLFRLRQQGYTEAAVRPEALRQPRSIFLRHIDCGSCNGCEIELSALSNPIYDIERFGIKFVSSPRHADMLMMTGPFVRNLEQAACQTFEAMSQPRKIIAIGDCAIDGGIFASSYAVTPRPAELEQAIVARVPGCPPSPDAILQALMGWESRE